MDMFLRRGSVECSSVASLLPNRPAIKAMAMATSNKPDERIKVERLRPRILLGGSVEGLSGAKGVVEPGIWLMLSMSEKSDRAFMCMSKLPMRGLRYMGEPIGLFKL